MRAAPDRRSKAGAKRFQPAVGSDFALADVPTIEATTRGFLARGLVSFVGVAGVVTGAHGFLTGNYGPLEAVWAVGGPIVGAMVAYYFGPQRRDSG